MRLFKILIILLLYNSCTHEKSRITNELKVGLVLFEQKELGSPEEDSNKIEKKNIFNGKIVEKKSDSIVTVKYYTEETGCPIFDGGYKVLNDTLTLYYQDLNFKSVKCIGFYKLEYRIRNLNLNYNKIKAQRLSPIKKEFSFK